MQSTLAVTSTSKLYRDFINITEYDKASVEKAKQIFTDYQSDGTILPGCSFEDNVWYLTNEYENKGLHFKIDVFAYKGIWEARLGLSLEEFIDCCKVFVTTQLGKRALSGIQSTLEDIRNVVSNKYKKLYDFKGFGISNPAAVEDFFSALPVGEDRPIIEFVRNALEERLAFNMYNRPANKARTLAEFRTYFEFDRIIKEFWASDLSPETRIFYFPLYLWWILTAVIPLRPKEFLVISRNCLSKSGNGDYYLKLRRTLLKGKSGKKTEYRIDGDFRTDTYVVPEYIGKAIEEYIDATKEYGSTEINSLFVTDPHYAKWKYREKRSDSRLLTYTNMNTILNYFYMEVIEDQLNYSVVYDAETNLGDNEICKIHLGDTRHIALINLMLEGGTPATAMYLAGHMNTSMGSHYYLNVKNLIECVTYQEYQRLTGSESEFQLTKPKRRTHRSEGLKLADGSFCFSECFANGDVEDCLKVAGPNGEIGYCPSCPLNRRDISAFFSDDDVYRSNLENDCNALLDAVNRYRRGRGEVEDVGRAMLRIRASSISYSDFLASKMAHEQDEESTEATNRTDRFEA